MGLLRLLFWVLLILAVIWFWRRLRSVPRPPANSRLDEPMVRCAECGVHLPKSRAIGDDGQWFCCKQHALRIPRDESDR